MGGWGNSKKVEVAPFSEVTPEFSWRHLQAVLEGFLPEVSIPKENLTYDRFFPVLNRAGVILGRCASAEGPSLFKKGAAVLIGFMEESPLIYPFPNGHLHADISKIKNHQNAALAFEFVRMGLHNAVIFHPTRGELKLTNPVKISPHYYFDLIHGLTRTTDDDSHFHLLSLKIEALVYKSNPGISDPETV